MCVCGETFRIVDCERWHLGRNGRRNGAAAQDVDNHFSMETHSRRSSRIQISGLDTRWLIIEWHSIEQWLAKEGLYGTQGRCGTMQKEKLMHGRDLMMVMMIQGDVGDDGRMSLCARNDAL